MLIFVHCENDPPHGDDVQDWAQTLMLGDYIYCLIPVNAGKETGAFLMRRRHPGNAVDSPKANEGVSPEVCKSDTAPGASLLSALSSPSNETGGSPKRGVRTCQNVSKSCSALTIEPLNETGGGCPQKCVKMYQSVSKSPNSLYVEALIEPLIGTRESPGETCQRNVKTVHRLALEWIRDPLPLLSALSSPSAGPPPKT